MIFRSVSRDRRNLTQHSAVHRSRTLPGPGCSFPESSNGRECCRGGVLCVADFGHSRIVKLLVR